MLMLPFQFCFRISYSATGGLHCETTLQSVPTPSFMLLQPSKRSEYQQVSVSSVLFVHILPPRPELNPRVTYS